MKRIYSCLTYVAILALLFTSCSKDENSSLIDEPANAKSVDLSFGAVLNDLANRAMSKSHFDQVPDCSEELPVTAVLEISYNNQTVGPIVVDVLKDQDGFFTDYSELLKIPVPNNGSTTVTLESFMVYDGNDIDAQNPYGNLIWIAPKESQVGQFDGYVDKALPFDFQVTDGSKPYIDVEVLCFDRRMVNEYGYVFFNILPEKIYPFCTFVNYCDENGRHYVADYAVDLYFGTDTNGIQLYDHNDQNAMANTGDYGEGNYYADPLCLVVPGPPANLADDLPYLYLVIYPIDWAGTGDIDDTPVPVALSWNMVRDLLNDDGTTNEYLHLLIGECEDALEGDGTIGGGNGCNPSSAEADCDDDQIPNKCDEDNANYAGFDCDGDDIPNGQEATGCVNNSSPDCGIDPPLACNLSIDDASQGCLRGVTPGSDAVDYADNGDFLMITADMDGDPIPLFEDTGIGYGPTAGNFTPSVSNGELTFNIVPNQGFVVTDMLIEVMDEVDGDVYCVDSEPSVPGTYTYPIYVRVKTNICEI
ncbi:hypothetical protein [Christiangramia salexigens]|uniref:Uncharacterized protein n=1 Tax=Christiangramia salexigens TaxID=1913577 RepID=A0A1L3J2A1_9FLAO|nr:hypothetical protein [Christiangramia salexigens]APG59246.1 hypothetical protein LPB144_01955 [Christiangramia salexigens]